MGWKKQQRQALAAVRAKAAAAGLDWDRMYRTPCNEHTDAESAFLIAHYGEEVRARERADAQSIADAVAAGEVVNDCPHRESETPQLCEPGEPDQCPLSWELGGGKICTCCEGCRASCAWDI